MKKEKGSKLVVAMKSQKYSHDFAGCCGHVSTTRLAEKHSHNCNKIAETFPRFCLVVVVRGL